MADESISKKTLIEVDIASEDANSKMSALATTINQVATSVKELQTATKNSSASLNDYAEKLAQSKLTAQQNREEITRLNLAKRQEKDAIDKAKTSIVAAKGSYDEAQKSLTALGRAIKSVEGGFKSTDPAIQKQIAEYKKLNTELGAFDKKLGNHQRNVGNYEGALKGLESTLDRLLPGFGQLQGILKGAAQGFNAMGSAATETGEAAVGAEVAVEGAAVAAGSAIAAVAAAIVAEGTYLLQFQKYADGLSKTWEGLKSGAMAAMNSINGVGKETKATGSAAVDMGVNFALAFSQASAAQGEILKTNREIKVDAVEAAIENAKIRKDMLIIMNLKSDELTFQKAYNEAHGLTVKQYEREKESQDKLHIALISRATAAYKIDKDDLKALYDVKGGYEAILKVTQKLVNNSSINADFLNEMVESAKKGVEIQGHYDVVEQLEKNKADRKQARLDKESARELTRSEKEQAELAKIKQEREQSESERLASIVRTLDFQREAFGKELADADEHYRQLIFKQQEFINKMQLVVESKKATPKEKAAAKAEIGTGNDTIAQLRKEQYANQEKLLQEHSKRMLEETQRAANDLTQLQIASIEDAQERERQFEELQYKEKNQALSKEGALLNENQAKLIAEIKTATGERKAVLQKELENTQALIEDANDKRRELQLQHQQKELDDLKRFSDQKQAIEDQTAVLKTSKSSVFEGDKNLLKAEQKQLLDKYNADVSVKGLTDEKKLELEQEYLNRSKQLNDTYIQNRTAYELQMASQVSNAGFAILQQSLQRSAQAQDVALNKQKDHDLQNTALTSTQKYIVNEKYRVKEGQAKAKQFKQEQKINIAKALIDGYLGIQKSLAEWGMPFAIPFIAATGLETALQVTAIAAQKAPAYAKGGTFQSDGRGSVLPGYSKTDNVNAHLRSGEAVVVSEAMRDPWAKSVVSAINQAYGGRAFDNTPAINWTMPGFASGGVFNNYLPTSDNGLRPQININQSPNRMHPGDIGQIVGGISSAIANMPPPVMDVKDMNYAQGRLAGAIDRLTY